MAQHASAGTDQAAHPLGKDGVIGNGVQGSTPNNSSSAHSDVGAGVTPPSSDSSGNSAGGTVNDGLSEAAMQACTAAHQARYGHLPQHQLQELVVLNRTLYV